MKVARLFGLVFIAVLAISAVVASTASAIPKFKLPITLRGFTALSLTSVLRALSPTGVGNVVTCTHDTVTGTIINDDEVFAKVHFLNCSVLVVEKGPVDKGPCTIKSVEAPAEGLILTGLLRGLLGLVVPGGGAGILFEPNTGRVFVNLAATAAPCETPETAVEGRVAGLLSPTGKLQNTATISLSVTGTSGTGKQEISEIEVLGGTTKASLKAFAVATATEESVDNATFEEPVEVD